MDWLRLLPLVIQAASTIKSIIDVANTNVEIVNNVKQTVPSLMEMFENYATQFFPKVRPELRVAAAAMAAFDPNVTKWLQSSLNLVLDPSPNLVVDGLYGPRTRTAVEAVQTKLGLIVDGWSGTLTQAALASVLAKRESTK